MKNLIKKTFVSLFAVLFSVNNAFAFWERESGVPTAVAPGTLGQNITNIINYFLGLLGLIAVAFLIYAGILMVTAGGNEEQVGKARKIIMYAVVGIVIILLSYTIVTFVTKSLGG